MVSLNPSLSGGGGGGGFYFDHSSVEMSALPGVGSVSTNTTTKTTTTATDLYEDSTKKIRKPYTITKSRESWSEQEHDKFLEALQLFDRDWKKIEAFVGSKTVIQIRSHAQKYFLKVQKSGTNEHLPPPRPKRKAAHPYPQKATKNDLSAPTFPHMTGALQSSSTLMESGYVVRPDSSAVLANPITGPPVSSWAQSSEPPVSVSHTSKDDTGSSRPMVLNNYFSRENTLSSTYPTCEMSDQENHGLPLQAIPDFAQVYNFIGSIFDLNTSDHLQKLKEMDPIDVETVLSLMRNLSMNLSSPDFEDHRKLLSSYDVDSEKVQQDTASNALGTNDSKILPFRSGM